MYNKGDIPTKGDIVKITNIDVDGFINNVFGGDMIFKRIEGHYKQNHLYGVLISYDNFMLDVPIIELYLLDCHNHILHDTCFLVEDDLQYIDQCIVDRPQCINELCTNMYTDQLHIGMKLKHVDGDIYIVDYAKDNNLYLTNIKGIKVYHFNIKSIDDCKKLYTWFNINNDTLDSNLSSDWMCHVDALSDMSHVVKRQYLQHVDALQRRAKMHIIK